NKTNIRLSYFKSISRPNYYELVPATLLSNSSPTSERGNPDLKHSVADNFDIRYELFPKEEEQLFIGGFYKKIKDPIEYAYESIETYTPQNLGTATVYGGEIVFTKYFGTIGVTGNYTYIYSEISSPKFYTDLAAQTTVQKLQKRPLQGQTNNSVNLSLLYRNINKKIFAQLAYEYVGKTLARVYDVYGYDYYQTPQSFLALSAEKQLRNTHFTAFGKFNNLLNTATINKINNLLVVKDNYKANFSIGLRYSN
ncbi:MAG: TonB-dependent receptor domain-containing protein, partial [Ginsengibacter sp.]